MTELQEAASAALTDFVYANGSDFDAIEWPGMAWLRSVLDAGVPGAGLDVILMAALADMAAAYHHEREHEGHWTHCQRPRCQNARLAGEGRGPFAAAQADTARPDDLDVAARAYLNDPDGYTAARLRAVLDTRPSRADTDSGELEALDWAITSLDNVRSVYPPGAEYWADDQRQKMNALRSLRAALAEPSRDAGWWPTLTAIREHVAVTPDGPRWGSQPVGLAANEAEQDRRFLLAMIDELASTVRSPDGEYVVDRLFDHIDAGQMTTNDGRELVKSWLASTVRSPLPDAAPSRDAGLDRDALYRRIHALPGLAHHGKGEQCFPITDAVLAALTDDGAPFPAGVNRADSEGER